MAQPSPFHLALALAIAKTRPIGISFRTYLNKIRKHIVEGSAAGDYGSKEKYIDAVRHWQSMYQQSRDETEGLLNKISSLEQQKKTLETRLVAVRQAPSLVMTRDAVIKQEDETSRPATALERPATAQPKSTVPKRRKNPFKDETRPQLQHKKLRVNLPADVGTADAPIVVPDELARFDDNKALNETITRHLLQAHKLYQAPTYDYAALSPHLIFIARGISDTISTQALAIQNELRKASVLPKDKGQRLQHTNAAFATLNTEFRRTKYASARAFMSLYHGLETLFGAGVEQARRAHGMVSYEMISTFDTLLETVEKACAIQATMEGDELVPKYNKATDLVKKRKDKRVDLAPVPQELTTLALALLSSPNPAINGPHSAVFEGCLYLLLERVAKRLHFLTFDHEQGTSIEEEIEMADREEERQVDKAKLKAVNLEVQFLVQLVERAMDLGPRFLGSLTAQKKENKNVRPGSSAARPASAIRPTTGTRPGNAPRPLTASKPATKASLSIAARERLQNTLVRCMYGPFPRSVDDVHDPAGDSETEDEEGAAGNNEFIDVLRKPVPMGEVPQVVMKAEEGNVKEWFRQEMWRMVGWDILARDDGW